MRDATDDLTPIEQRFIALVRWPLWVEPRDPKDMGRSRGALVKRAQARRKLKDALMMEQWEGWFADGVMGR